MNNDDARSLAAEVISKKMGHTVHAADLAHISFPRVFGSTAGPFGGIGGASMTTFQIDAFQFDGQWAAIFCRGRLWTVTEHFHFDALIGQQECERRLGKFRGPQEAKETR